MIPFLFFRQFTYHIVHACRNDFYNTTNGVVITIYAKGVAAEDLEIDYGEQMVRQFESRNAEYDEVYKTLE